MSQLHQRHCLNHALREAVARCPECGHFYCRECIVEHEDRVLCAVCLRKIFGRKERKDSLIFTWLARGGAFGISLFLSWLAFYWAGRILLSIPVNVHNGTLWQTGFWQE